MTKTYRLKKKDKIIGSVRCVINNRNSVYFAELQPSDSNYYIGLDSEVPIKKFDSTIYTIEANTEPELYELLNKSIIKLLGDNVELLED